MATATSKVDICNLSLSHLKQEVATNIDTPVTNQEVICSRWYDVTRRSVLRKNPWNFAIKRRELPRGGAPEFGFSDYYNIPTDFIRLLTIGDYETSLYIEDAYQVEDGKLLLNNEGGSLKIRYIYDQEDVIKFDSLFITLLSLELALNMAYEFTASNGVIQRLALLKETAELTAKAIDGQERPPVRVESSRFLNAHNGSSYGSGTGSYRTHVVFN